MPRILLMSFDLSWSISSKDLNVLTYRRIKPLPRFLVKLSCLFSFSRQLNFAQSIFPANSIFSLLQQDFYEFKHNYYFGGNYFSDSLLIGTLEKIKYVLEWGELILVLDKDTLKEVNVTIAMLKCKDNFLSLDLA